MSKWKQSSYPAGTEVRLLRIDSNYDEDAIMLTGYDIEDENTPMPLFKLSDGKVIHGSDCWWIPKAELGPESEAFLDDLKKVT